MKGIVLGVWVLVVTAFSSAAGENDFALTNSPAVAGEPASMIRPVVKSVDPLARLVTDDRAEVRGGKPTVAYTVVRFTSASAEVSFQPIFGRINGAQVQLSF